MSTEHGRWATEIERTIQILFADDTVVELRIPKAKDNSGKFCGTVSGYYDGDHRQQLADDAARYSGRSSGIYVTLNPVTPDLLARSMNRATPWARNTTSDDDIVRRVWLPVDCDPKRPSGISANDAEHQAALNRAREIREELGFCDPVFADSGNGAHLLYGIDMPNDRAAKDLIKWFLGALADKFSDDKVTVDRGVYNAARIWKLYGTVAAKGDPTEDRPHRLARMIDVPDEFGIVTVKQLEAVAAPKVQVPVLMAAGSFDLESWIRKHNVPIVKTKPWKDGTLFELARCPWRPEETDGGAFVIQHADGDVTAGCHHDKCKDKGWDDLRSLFEPVAREADDDPHRLARLVLEQEFHNETLKFWRNTWHGWSAGAWKLLDNEELQAMVTRRIKEEFDRKSESTGTQAKRVRTSLVNNVLLAMKSLVLLPSDVDQPCWLSEPGPWPPDEVLVAKNGLIHLPSLVEGTDYLLPHTPSFFTPAALNYEVRKDADAPRQWLEFLDQLWPNDAESIAALQQWFGYLLLPDTGQQKMLTIIGPKRSGKGTIGRVLTNMVGRHNVVAPALSQLASDFGLQSLLGKTVAIISDARLDRRRGSSMVVERLLSITGEDMVTVERKHLTAITTKLPTRFVMLSNELPAFTDVSGALASRMILLRLTNSFFGKEDIDLTTKLAREMPGILLWAIDGFTALREQGHFVEPTSAQDLRADLEELTSPVATFVNECCNVGEAYSIPRAELYTAFVAWCTSKGQTKYIPIASTFGRDLRTVVPAISDSQPRENGKRVRHYVGIDLSAGFRRQLENDLDSAG